MSSCKMCHLDNPSCCYCETPFELFSIRTREHIIPLCRGGKSGLPNKASCCPTCNNAKGWLLPSEFLNKIEEYYALKKNFNGIKVELMPTIILNLKIIFIKKEQDINYLNPTAKRLAKSKL